MTDEDMRRLWAEIKANSEKLKGCPGHRFTLPEGAIGPTPILSRVKVPCTVCGGTMALNEAMLFMEGVLAHERDASLADSAHAFDAALNETWKQRKAKRGQG